jgi:hypothetical protein
MAKATGKGRTSNAKNTMTGAGTANGQPYKTNVAKGSYPGKSGTASVQSNYSSGSKRKEGSASQPHLPSSFTAHKGEGNFAGVQGGGKGYSKGGKVC